MELLRNSYTVVREAAQGPFAPSASTPYLSSIAGSNDGELCQPFSHRRAMTTAVNQEHRQGYLGVSTVREKQLHLTRKLTTNCQKQNPQMPTNTVHAEQNLGASKAWKRNHPVHMKQNQPRTFREVPRPKTSVDVNKVTNHRLVNMLSSTPSSERCCLKDGQWRRNSLSREKKHRSSLSSPWHHNPCNVKKTGGVGHGTGWGGGYIKRHNNTCYRRLCNPKDAQR